MGHTATDESEKKIGKWRDPVLETIESVHGKKESVEWNEDRVDDGFRRPGSHVYVVDGLIKCDDAGSLYTLRHRQFLWLCPPLCPV